MPILVLESKEGQRARVQLTHIGNTITHINPLVKYNNLGVGVENAWVKALIRTAVHNKKNLFIHGVEDLSHLGFKRKTTPSGPELLRARTSES